MEAQIAEHPEAAGQDEEHPELEVHAGEHLAPEVPAGEPPAVSIRATGRQINPLATLIIGLVLGVLVGYLGRPLVTSEPQASASVDPESIAGSSAAAPPTAVAGSAGAGASSQTLMDAMISQTRHFKGDPDAPVTMIEFSDFQ